MCNPLRSKCPIRAPVRHKVGEGPEAEVSGEANHDEAHIHQDAACVRCNTSRIF